MQHQRDEREKGKRQRKDEKDKEKERNQVKKKLSGLHQDQGRRQVARQKSGVRVTGTA